MRQILAYGVPVELRPSLEAAVQGLASVLFPSINRPITSQKHRLGPDGQDVVALWGEVQPIELDSFLADTGVGLFHIVPIEIATGVEDGVTTIGLRFVPALNVQPDDPLLSGSVAPEPLEAARELADLTARRVPSVLLSCVPSPRPLLIVAPRKKWLVQIGTEAFAPLVDSLRQDYPDHDLAIVADTGVDYFEWLQAGEIHAVIREPLERGWLPIDATVLTNDPAILDLCREAGVPVVRSLQYDLWEPLPEEEIDPEAEPEVVVVESPEALYVTGCHYFPTETAPGRFEPLAEALTALKAALVQEEPRTILCEQFISEDTVLDPETVVFEPLTGGYPVLHFDDRTRKNTLTCILPFRYAPERRDALERLHHIRMDSSLGDDICFLLVDDGSEPEMAPKVREACAEMGFSYVGLDTAEQPFSVGRCRNVGAEYSRSEFIFMQDIDLMPYDGFYRDLLLEIDAQSMRENGRHFLMIPYIFLTKQGTDLYKRTDPALRRQRLIHASLVNDKNLVEKFSVGTSANLYNRQWYLSRGGNSPDFVGWGYEDLECNTRMIRHLSYFSLPVDWATEEFNFNSVVEYRTYKALYRLFGDMAMMKGIALFHAWHPVTETGDYAAMAKINREIFIKKLQNFPKTQQEPDPLPDRSAGKTLVFRQNAFTILRTTRPAFGELMLMRRESSLPNKGSFEAFVAHHGITRILFFNPFQTPHMRRLQQWTREIGLPFVVGERGALPNSSFYDSEGFLADSVSYDPARWDRPLNRTEQRGVREYVGELHRSKPALESQPDSIGGAALRRLLGIHPDEVVIFVPLQRPGDTVTRFFFRDVSYPEFEAQVRELAGRDLPGIRILIKTHPLEESAGGWANASIVDDRNVYDLLEAADLIWTFNSGTGVLAMAWDRPVALSGRAFFKAEGVNHEVSGPDDVVALARDLPAFDTTKAHRFLHHLTQNLYSFGKQITKPVRMPDGSRMTATTDIQFTTLRIEDRVTHFKVPERPAHDTSGILFDRYRFAMKADRKK